MLAILRLSLSWWNINTVVMYPCGVLQAFAIQAENIVRGTDRRADLDKGYKLLMDAILVAIERVALEHQKTPSDVVTMGTVCSYSPVGT